MSLTVGLCYEQLESSLRQLAKNQEIRREYNAMFQYQLEQGIVEEAPAEPDGPVHYLPHRHVLTPGKSNKLGVVFNANAKGKSGIGLNKALEKGTLMLPPHMVRVLLRARLYEKLLVADVEKAFLQISLRARDRDVARFF